MYRREGLHQRRRAARQEQRLGGVRYGRRGEHNERAQEGALVADEPASQAAHELVQKPACAQEEKPAQFGAHREVNSVHGRKYAIARHPIDADPVAGGATGNPVALGSKAALRRSWFSVDESRGRLVGAPRGWSSYPVALGSKAASRRRVS